MNVTDSPNTDGFTDDVKPVVVDALFTAWLTADDVLPLKLPSDPYSAVIEWVATVSDDVSYVATPEPLSVPVPMLVAPSLKVTVPVGIPAPGATTPTVAVNVTDSPNNVGFTVDVNPVVVDALSTT